MLIKQKSLSLLRNIALATFGKLLIMFKVISAIPPLFNNSEVLSSACDKAKLFAKNFSKNSNLNGLSISLLVSPSRANLQLHNISILSRMAEKVTTNLDSSKESGPDCIPVDDLKNCEPELSYILAEFFNKCLKESCFRDCCKVSSVVPVVVWQLYLIERLGLLTGLGLLEL